MNLLDKLVEVYNQPPKKQFDFEINQTVRILKNLTVDTYYIEDLLGEKGMIVNRYTTGLHKDNKYEVKFKNGRTETFDETELDKRFKRRV